MRLGQSKRSSAHLALTVPAFVVLALGMGCGPRAGDINQVQPGYVDKTIFQQNSAWYYRRTIAKSETTNAYALEGLGDAALEKVRWRIEENVLIAYKPYEAIPGEETSGYPGTANFEGVTLAAFPINDHFDIKRGYDPGTGNDTNVVSENTLDRPWYERQYMRVNWAVNQIDRSIDADFSGEWFPISYISTGSRWTEQDSNPADEFASRFTSDYIEVNQDVLLGMDLFTCAAFVGDYGAGFQNCGYGEAKVRHSFVRIKTPSDFVPVSYPDSIVRTSSAGTPISDPTTGEVLREPIFSRFGYFRTQYPTYDRGYGTTETGQIFRAYVLNLWQNSRDASGQPLPLAQRTPKPIIYYLNAEFPTDWMAATATVAAEYDRVFTSMVSDLVGAQKTPSHMFEIRQNDCNVANIQAFVTKNPQTLPAITRAVCPSGGTCTNPLSLIALGNLTTTCTSLEAFTRDPLTHVPTFDWQRTGDARWFMINWLSNPQQGGWIGLGLGHADAQTGETVAGSVYIQGSPLQVMASNVADYIALINDETTIDQVIYGQDIRKQVAAEVANVQAMAHQEPSEAFLTMINQRLATFGSGRSSLQPADPLEQANRLKRSQGSRVETPLINDLDIAMASGGAWKRGDPVSDQLRQSAAPYARIVEKSSLASARRQVRRAFAASGMCFNTYDFDRHFAGLALALKNIPPAQRYVEIVNRVVVGIMLHELGHNMGLRHNFEASFDALNYPDAFWQGHLVSATDATSDELRNASVMEYLGDKTLLTTKLGKYDEAALRFGYANQVSTFTSTAVDPSFVGGTSLQSWRYRNDYEKIPDHLCGGNGCNTLTERLDVLKQRSWVTFNPQNPPVKEVPFHFCSDEYDSQTPFCASFDYGSNLREIFGSYHTIWADYFFFNNFVRDRLSPLAWNPDYAIAPLEWAMAFADTVGQYYYYMNAVDPTFPGSDLAADMLVTTANGLNMATEVMAQPEPVRQCPWPQQSNPTIYIPWTLLTTCDRYAPLNGPTAVAGRYIQPPLGAARPSTLGFTEDYEDWDWSYIGSYFDKSNLLWLLGYNQPHFYRFDYDLDIRNYYINLYRLYEPEIRAFMGRVANYDGYIVEKQLALDLGSYWCADPTNPNVASAGYIEPRRLVDVTATGTNSPSLPGASKSCLNPALIYPVLLPNMSSDAMYYAYALFSSDFDSSLNLGKSFKVYVVGSDDDYPNWDALAPAQYCTLVDSLTQVQYRAIHQPYGEDVACNLIAHAAQAQADYQNTMGDTDYKDRWRAWMERLEWIRDLGKMYDLSSVDIPTPTNQ